MDLKSFLLSPKGLIYLGILAAFLIGFFTSVWVARFAGIALFLFEFSFFAAEGFTCPKCGLGTLAAVVVIVLSFGFSSIPLLGLAAALILADITIHAV